MSGERARRLLAVETGFERYSLALAEWRAGQPRVAAEHLSRPGDKASTWLQADIAALLAEAGWALDALDSLAVSTGPGGFTGLRVGTAAIQGLARATGRPVYPLDALRGLALAAPEAETLRLPMIDVRRGQVSARLYERTDHRSLGLHELSVEITDTPSMLAAELPLLRHLQPVLLGTGALRHRALWRSLLGGGTRILDSPTQPSASVMAKDLLARMAEGTVQPAAIEALTPRYARPASAEFPPVDAEG